MVTDRTELLTGLQIIKPRLFPDERGFFYESYQAMRYQALGIPTFVQDNVSRSKKHVIRGLHYQLPQAQGKLVYVSCGSIWDVAVDIRHDSPTFGQWSAVTLTDENHWQFYIPPGFAHGFCVLSDVADVHYKCTDYYSPPCEHGIIWNDPGLNIPWPTISPILSPKDTIYPTLKEMTDARLFTF